MRPPFRRARGHDDVMTLDFDSLAPQAQLDVFLGKWLYEIPLPGATSGQAKGFEKQHPAVWLAERTFGSLTGMSCLELGPFEGVVTHSLDRAGCDPILAVEVRELNYLKCLVAKNLLDWKRARFVLADFMGFLAELTPVFDICFACGVLYHMPEPLRFIELVAPRARRFVFSTVYVSDLIFTPERIKESSGLPQVEWNITSREGEPVSYKGLDVRYYRNEYPFDPTVHATLGAGGHAMYSNMLTRDDILKAVEHFGMRIAGEVLDYPEGDRGPQLWFCAERR